MATEEYAHWQALKVRCPDDVRTIPGGPVPLRWQAEKHGEHADRLGNNLLPADFEYEVERGDAGDALAVLALGEAMRRDIGYSRGHRIHEALTLGATWPEVATALDITVNDAQGLLRAYADQQHNLYQRDVVVGRGRRLGFDDDAYTSVIALCDDPERAKAGS